MAAAAAAGKVELELAAGFSNQAGCGGRACVQHLYACVHALTYMFLYVYIYIYVHIEMAFAMHARVPGRGYERPRSVNIT